MNRDNAFERDLMQFVEIYHGLSAIYPLLTPKLMQLGAVEARRTLDRRENQSVRVVLSLNPPKERMD